MKLLSHTEFLEEFCRATGKFAMYVNCYDMNGEDPGMVTPMEEFIKAAPYLKKNYQILADGSGYLVFDTEEEMNKHYRLTVGNDGPTKQNPYQGPARVYALTCGPAGTVNENT